MNDTFLKGNIALTKVMADLTEKGYDVLKPIQEQLPYDLAIFKNGKFFRIQVKYDGDSSAVKATCHKYIWYKKKCKTYQSTDFDYYAIYCPAVRAILYPSVKFGGATFRLTPPNSVTPYYRYEDFLELTDEAEKRINLSIDWDAATKKRAASYTPKRKVERPPIDVLLKEIEDLGFEGVGRKYGVSGNSIRKWAK